MGCISNWTSTSKGQNLPIYEGISHLCGFILVISVAMKGRALMGRPGALVAGVSRLLCPVGVCPFGDRSCCDR